MGHLVSWFIKYTIISQLAIFMCLCSSVVVITAKLCMFPSFISPPYIILTHIFLHVPEQYRYNAYHVKTVDFVVSVFSVLILLCLVLLFVVLIASCFMVTDLFVFARLLCFQAFQSLFSHAFRVMKAETSSFSKRERITSNHVSSNIH